MSPEEARELLRVSEVARILSISRSKAYQLAAAGDLPGVVRIGGSIRVSQRHLIEWIDKEAEGDATQGFGPTDPRRNPGDPSSSGERE